MCLFSFAFSFFGLLLSLFFSCSAVSGSFKTEHHFVIDNIESLPSPLPPPFIAFGRRIDSGREKEKKRALSFFVNRSVPSP